MSISRRALLSSAGLTLLTPLAGAGRASAAPPAPDAAGLRTASLRGDLAAIPDPLGLSGAWTRTADGGQRVVTGAGHNAVALSEQRIEALAGYAARITVDPGSPYAVGSLVVRAADDGSAGYAAGVDPHLRRIRLYDLATGRDLVPPATADLAPGTGYLLEVTLDGPELTVLLDGRQVLAARDTAYGHGAAGLHAYNGTVVFGPPGLRSVTTDVTGWTTDAGTWTATSLGWHAQAPADTNCRAVSSTRVHDTAYQAEISITDPYAVAALLLRTDAQGLSGYGVQIDPNLNRLRLYRIDGDITLGTHSTTIDVDRVYRLRVEADGPRIRVHWQTDFIAPDGYAPVITAQETTHGSGLLGVLAYNGSVHFEGIAASGLVTDLQGWATVSGDWTRDLRGLRAEGTGALHIAPFPGGDVLISADIGLAGATGAGLVFRADAAGAGGYEARLDANGVRLLDRADGTELGRAAPPVRPFATGGTYRTGIHALGTAVTVTVDGVDVITATATAARTGGSTVGLAATGGTAHFQEVRARTPRTYYTDVHRPGHHYTQLASHTSDPNGLVHHEGEYHLFHQDSGQWAHAVSTDLLHWRALPVALPVSDFGHTWSGSCVVDSDDTSGLFGGRAGLIAHYTSYHPDRPGGNQCVRVAFSKDRGRSWQWYGPDPVVQNPGGPDGGWDFRDPKVVRDTRRDQWVMVVSGGDHVRFFTSTDLLHWAYRSSFGYGAWVSGGVWECPDLFPLPVDGDPDRVRWVLALSTGAVRSTDGSAAEYFLGDWDGTAFTTTNSAGTPLRVEAGRDYYAAMTFHGLPDGRRVQLGWLSNWDYAFSAPTGEWNGQLSIPRELTLSGRGLVQRPAAEVETLRTGGTTIEDVVVSPGSADPLAALSGRSYEIEAEIALPATGAATEFGFRLRTGQDRYTLVGYDAATGKLFVDRGASGTDDFTEHFAGRTSAALPLTSVDGERRLRIRLFMDTSSVEVFGGHGLVSISSLLFPEADDRGMACYATGGAARIITMTVHRLRDTFRVTDSDPEPAGTSPGGTFRSGGLGDLTVVPAGHWTTTGAGRTGVFDRDSTAVSSTEYGDLELTTLVRFGGPDGAGGAGSVLLRTTPDTTDGYAVNLDPNLRTVRLFRRDGGLTTVLAEAPLLIRAGVSLPLRIRARGARIEAFVDGRQVVDVTDTRHTRGRIGLNVFGGRAAYQDTFVTAL
ncbi:glycoside hydrolase family 32 protein [Streptomyces sp. JV185]|uniref:glycoside hydrolase family 32 protein n=1 Tax=Streptomyces sp. JV185 TaxID=858638 RepID=UPI002E76E722|nr:glycoside hydrolase family 32 protein [Streptomyces sp. JV185]MEE1772557.1 glycoside hydrolase family 32 protein [Streptomyces sp. JV185]